MKKRMLKSKPVCKVTFELPAEAAPAATAVNLVGDFNDWDTGGTPMKRRKDGSFSVTIDLDTDREYQYKYLIDSQTWENDWAADKYTPSPLGDGDNSVVVV
jgi:1,4-alpha-glucan branching enzyme